MSEQENDSRSFIVDSGCTSNMTNQLEFLSNTHKSEVYISSAKKGQGMSGTISGDISYIKSKT